MDNAKQSHISPMMAPASAHTLRTLESYWKELRGARTLPFRSDIDPVRIDDALPHAFILQRVSDSMGRVRVGGQRLSNLLGMDPRGMPLTTFFTPAGRMVVADYTRRVFDDPSIVELPLFSPRSIGRPKLLGRMMLLPLNGEDGTVSMAMGAIITEGTTGRSPRRFEVPTDGIMRCDPVLDMRSNKPMRSRMEIVGSNTAPIKKGPSERPALRLVVDND